MALLRPSLTLVLDLDENAATEETVLEIKRNYAHICTPVVRTHAAGTAPARNVARMLVNMGTYRYLRSADEGADARWTDIVAPWIGNMLHKVGNNMKIFNDRQRKIGLPEVVFERVDIELQGGAFTVSLRPDAHNALYRSLQEHVELARELLDDGTLRDAVRVDMPADESYDEQRARALEAWIAERPESLEAQQAAEREAADGASADVAAEVANDASATAPEADAATSATDAANAPVEPEKTYEQLLQEDIEAKSYENTAVPPTDSNVLPRPQREEEDEEPERFNFDVDYALWTVSFADGSTRTFDSRSRAFAD